MADAALTIYDEDTGQVLVDSINFNLFLRHKGVAYKNNYYWAQVELPANTPVVFVRSLEAYGAITPASENLGNGLFRFSFWGDTEYYIFDRPWDTSGPLNIWSEDGRHIFQGGEVPLTIYDSPDIGNWWGEGRGWQAGYNWDKLPTSKYAVNQSYPRLGHLGLPGGPSLPVTITYKESFLPHPNGFRLIYEQEYSRVNSLFNGATGFYSFQEVCRYALIDVSSFSV